MRVCNRTSGKAVLRQGTKQVPGRDLLSRKALSSSVQEIPPTKTLYASLAGLASASIVMGLWLLTRTCRQTILVTVRHSHDKGWPFHVAGRLTGSVCPCGVGVLLVQRGSGGLSKLGCNTTPFLQVQPDKHQPSSDMVARTTTHALTSVGEVTVCLQAGS